MDANRVRDLVETVIADGFLDDYPSISSLYLSGSLVRGDYVSGFSDLDLIVVGERIVDTEVKTLKKQLSKTLQGIEVSISTYSVLGIERERVESYLLSMDSVLVAGADILAATQTPSKEEIIAYGTRMLDRQIDDWIKYSEERTPSLVDEAPGNIYMVLKLAQTALLAKGIVCLGAREILSEFSEQFEGQQLVSYVREAYELKTSWKMARTDIERLESFAGKATGFAYLLRDQPH
jgi:predicted nucleotidyltransferase